MDRSKRGNSPNYAVCSSEPWDGPTADERAVEPNLERKRQGAVDVPLGDTHVITCSLSRLSSPFRSRRTGPPTPSQTWAWAGSVCWRACSPAPPGRHTCTPHTSGLPQNTCPLCTAYTTLLYKRSSTPSSCPSYNPCRCVLHFGKKFTGMVGCVTRSAHLLQLPPRRQLRDLVRHAEQVVEALQQARHVADAVGVRGAAEDAAKRVVRLL